MYGRKTKYEQSAQLSNEACEQQLGRHLSPSTSIVRTLSGNYAAVSFFCYIPHSGTTTDTRFGNKKEKKTHHRRGYLLLCFD